MLTTALRPRRAIAYVLAVLLLALLFIVAIAIPALAGPLVLAASADDPTPVFEFSIPPALVIGIITGAVIPALVAGISRLVDRISSAQLSSLAKGLVLSALAAVSGILTTLGDKLANPSGPIDLGVLLITFASSFVVGVTAYFGLLSRPSANGRSLTGTISGSPVG